MTGNAQDIARRDDGFTLIEMIVALALLSIIAGLLAGGTYGMRRVLAIVNRSETNASVQTAQSYLRSALAQASPRSGAGTEADPALIGDAVSLRLRTSYAPRGQLEGFYRVALTLEPSPGRHSTYDLVVRHTLLRPPPQDGAEPPPPVVQSSRLVTGTHAMSLSYFGAPDDSGEAPRWLDSWSAAGKLPKLVRITVTFPAGDERAWPPLTLPLQLANGGSSNCGVRQPC